MKLRNKRTGDIWEFEEGFVMKASQETAERAGARSGVLTCFASSLAELNEDWEDYEEPEVLKDFWYIDLDGEIQSDGDVYEDNTIKGMKIIGNYFGIREEAEKAVEKLRAWKRLKDNGFEIKGWKFTPDMKRIEGNYVKIEAEVPQILINKKDIDLLFGGEE